MKREEFMAQRQPKPSKKAVWLSRLVLVGIALTVCGTAVFIIYGQLRRNVSVSRIVQFGGDAALSTAERLYLEAILVANVDELEQPAGSNVVPVSFAVNAGEGANQIAQNLHSAGLLDNPELFLNYIRFYGYDSQLEAGNFIIQSGTTIPELAQLLQEAVPNEVTVTFLEGWRAEEMADYLRKTQPAQINADQFLAIAKREAPYNLGRYDFLSSHPNDQSLEGFLFPDTYRLPLDADADYLVNLMLENFGTRISPAMRQAYGTQGLSLREAVTLASIVQREAVLASERPLIAGVFLNRLDQGMMLQADPTVQYAVGYDATSQSWWKTPLWVADLEMNSPYNTYVYTGLPPGPIANPGLEALEAVAFPKTTDYIFFVAHCDGSGAHRFSVTYEEHVANVALCR